MSIEKDLRERCDSRCELCNSSESLFVYTVPPETEESIDTSILICNVCFDELENGDNVNYWRCLNETMWSQAVPVQVMVWRILDSIRDEGWPQDMLDMLYLEDDVLIWAKSLQGNEDEEVIHKDSNGATLIDGDSVTLIKDLTVKGAGFTAKRGTMVRNISLVSDNEEQIEGRVEGQRIVILAKFVKKV